MTLRVWVQNIWPAPADDTLIGSGMADVYDRSRELMLSILGADTEIGIGFNPRSSYLTSCASLEAFNNVGLLNGLMTAEQDGYDVAVIACGNDPALKAARTALTIPVVGLTESAMLLACMLGRRFGVVAMDDASAPLVEENLALHGLEARAIRRHPVRSGGFYEDISRWFRDPAYVRDHVIPRFETVARGLIDEGAEVIVTACGAYAALPLNGYGKISGTEAPVIDATVAASHMAGVLGRLKQQFGVATSKQRSFKGVPAEVAAQMLGLAALGR